MKIINPQKIIEREKELQELSAMKKILLAKGTVTQSEINIEKAKQK